MKPRFIILMIIFVVLLSGCSTKSKKLMVKNDSSYTLEEKDKARDATNESTKEDLKDNIQDKPLSNNLSVSQATTVKKEVQATKSISLREKLFDYLSTDKNRNSVAERANELHRGTLHNSCVYYASEALRRVGVKIPVSMSLIPPFIDELKRQGFKTSYNLEELKSGDIGFTTDVNGVVGGRPTHTYIFMGWESPGVARIVDNQLYDYGDVYHTRLIDFHYLNNMKDKPKEATAFFMYK